MAQYRFIWGLFGGTGSITVNGAEPQPSYEEGTSLTILGTFDSGFTFGSYNINNGFLSAVTNPWTFTMPSRDVKLRVNLTGTYSPTDTDYELKYFSETEDQSLNLVRIEIYEFEYTGAATQKDSAGFSFRWGNFGTEEIEPIVRSFFNFGLVGMRDEYFELLEGGYRKWQVKVLINSTLFWKGYINNSTLTINEVGIKEVMEFTASDGLNSFDSKRVIEQYFQGFAANSMLAGFFGTLNQTFNELRPINIACEIYETRLDRDDSVFSQLLIPANAVYTDGETPIYYGNGEIAENTSVYISEFLDALLKPFLCRVFLWRDEFYIISLPELAKDSYRLFNFDTEANFEGITTITPGMDVSCKFTAGQRTGRPVYTEFTGTLELGVLDYSSRGGIYEEPFSVDSWIYTAPTSSNPNVYQLRAWGYVNAVATNQPPRYPVPGAPFFDPAFVQYVSDSLGEYAKIWGTSSVSGIGDSLLSFLELDSTRTGQDIAIAQDLANTLSFQIEYIFEPRSGVPGVDPERVNTNAGIQIRIGDSYLSYDGDVTFTWTTTPTIMQFPMGNPYSWNKVDIVSVVVPEDGAVIIRLYEVITTNAASVNRYTVGYRNMSLKIEENDAFATESISEKFVTDESYSNVYPEVKFKIGDVDTENSTSAIRLDLVGYGFPNSQLWSRDGVEELPLIQVFLQELANIKGKQNPRLILTLPRDAANPLEIKPYQNIEYDGHYWMVVAMEVDLMANSWRLELARLDTIGS
jgi:hypothetical protein